MEDKEEKEDHVSIYQRLNELGIKYSNYDLQSIGKMMKKAYVNMTESEPGKIRQKQGSKEYNVASYNTYFLWLVDKTIDRFYKKKKDKLSREKEQAGFFPQEKWDVYKMALDNMRIMYKVRKERKSYVRMKKRSRREIKETSNKDKS